LKKWDSLIITILYLSLSACISTNQPDEKVPLIAYCNLVANPSQYDGQVVRVSASYVVGFEWSYLTDEKCSSDSSSAAQTWIIPDDTWCEGVTQTSTFPLPEHNHSESLERKVTIMGKFYNSSGGHLGKYPFQMEFICLERAGKWRVVP
jgi:starvation-inducible outer membrane lipoprotein